METKLNILTTDQQTQTFDTIQQTLATIKKQLTNMNLALTKRADMISGMSMDLTPSSDHIEPVICATEVSENDETNVNVVIDVGSSEKIDEPGMVMPMMRTILHLTPSDPEIEHIIGSDENGVTFETPLLKLSLDKSNCNTEVISTDFVDPFLYDVNANVIDEKCAETGIVAPLYVLDDAIGFCTSTVCQNVYPIFRLDVVSYPRLEVRYMLWKLVIVVWLDTPPPFPPDISEKVSSHYGLEALSKLHTCAESVLVTSAMKQTVFSWTAYFSSCLHVSCQGAIPEATKEPGHCLDSALSFLFLLALKDAQIGGCCYFATHWKLVLSSIQNDLFFRKCMKVSTSITMVMYEVLLSPYYMEKFLKLASLVGLAFTAHKDSLLSWAKPFQSSATLIFLVSYVKHLVHIPTVLAIIYEESAQMFFSNEVSEFLVENDGVLNAPAYLSEVIVYFLASELGREDHKTSFVCDPRDGALEASLCTIHGTNSDGDDFSKVKIDWHSVILKEKGANVTHIEYTEGTQVENSFVSKLVDKTMDAYFCSLQRADFGYLLSLLMEFYSCWWQLIGCLLSMPSRT